MLTWRQNFILFLCLNSIPLYIRFDPRCQNGVGDHWLSIIISRSRQFSENGINLVLLITSCPLENIWIPWSSGPALRKRIMDDTKRLVLHLMLCWCGLEILCNFLTRGPHFHFCITGPEHGLLFGRAGPWMFLQTTHFPLKLKMQACGIALIPKKVPSYAFRLILSFLQGLGWGERWIEGK